MKERVLVVFALVTHKLLLLQITEDAVLGKCPPIYHRSVSTASTEDAEDNSPLASAVGAE